MCEAIASYGDNEALRWPEIAEFIPHRTGKQCRERYLTRLKPNIKHNMEWTPSEDALLFHLYASLGSKWSLISKLLEGRSDNAVKNRYHFVRRKLERLVTFASSATNQGGKFIDAMPTSDSQQKINFAIASVLALGKSQLSLSDWQYESEEKTFGPFVTPNEGICCQRCYLVVPSEQTGRSICSKTGWCQSCVTVPPYVSGDHLIKFHERAVENARMLS